MNGFAFLMIALLGAGGPSEYSRTLNAKKLDQAALDAEGYGEKKNLKREDDGLRITLAPGETETGWKTPQQLRFGGDFTISANLVIKTLPKPAQEDGAAIGIAIAFQDITQPDLTLVRVREPKGGEVYRSIDKGVQNPMQPQFAMPFFQPGGGPPPKPPRRTSPAAGDTVRLEIQREGNVLRLQVLDAISGQPRYLGQVMLGANDVASVKLFASNRNGAEAVNVLMRDLSIRADRVTGLGTTVRSIFGSIVYAEPTSIEDGILIVGGQPKSPPPEKKPEEPKKPADAKPATPAAGTPGDKKPETKPAQEKEAASAKAETPKNAEKAETEKGTTKTDEPAKGSDAPKSDSSKKDDTKPADTKPAETKPADTKPAETKPADGKPAETKPADGKPADNAAKPQAAQQKPTVEPKAKIPLNEVESIHFERTPTMSGRLIGQVNLDFTMPGLSAKKDDPTPAKDESKKSDAKKDDAKKDDSKKDDAKKDDSKKDDAKKDDSKKDDVKKDDAKKDDSKKDDAKKGDAKKKSNVADDPLAPPPGTTINKVARVYPKKNGIRDLDLSLSGLRNVAIKQVMVTCQTDKGPTSWRLDTTDSQDWPLVVRRSGTEGSADLFLEPPAGDCFEKDFNVNLTYEDGQAGNATVKSKIHTDPKLAIDPKASTTPPLDAWVYLTGDEKLFGRIGELSEETLQLTTPAQDLLKLPLARVIGIHFALLDRKETPEAFAKRLKTRGSEDTLLAQTKNSEVLAIPGVVERSENDKLHFLYQGKSRTLPLKQVEGLIMAVRPDVKPTDELRPTFTLPGGVIISGRWKDLDTSSWTIETAWGQELKLPAADIQGVRFLGGMMTFLSDLTPSKVEETPFFGRRLPWKRDIGLLGESLKMNGQTYERGIAMHSRCVLTYDLNGRYASLETLVGFDDSARGKGRVDCRILGDGKELYANPDLRADGQPIKLTLPVAGVEQLKLSIDFGHGQDTGDRVIWANARLYRQTKSEASPAPKSTSGPASGADPGKTTTAR